MHPRRLLLSTNGPFGFDEPTGLPRWRWDTKQHLRAATGQGRKPLYPFELAVECFVLRRR